MSSPVVDLLTTLVKINSVSGEESGIVVYLRDYLREIGLATKQIGNSLLVSIKNQGNKRALIFNAHIDTVSAGEITNWVNNPLSGKVVHGKLYGLGAADDKASVAAMIKCFEWLKDQDLRSDFYLMLVEGEEIAGIGTRNVLEFMQAQATLSGYDYVAAVVGEPTELNAQIGHRGAVLFDIEFKGGSGHASKPQDVAVHAIYDAARFVNQLNELQKELEDKYTHKLLGRPTICATNIVGLSGATNKISEKCVVKVDMRPTPEMGENYSEYIQKILPTTAQITGVYATHAGYTKSDAQIVALYQQLVPSKKVDIAAFASDLCWLSREGIDAIVCGPGNASVIHNANEYVEIDQLEAALELYRSLAKQF